MQAVDDAVERCLDVGEVQFGLRQLRLGLGLRQFGLEQYHLILRDDRFLLEQPLGVIELQFREPGLGQLGVQLCLVKNWYDLEHHIALLHRLALLDRDLLEIPALQGTDVDVALRVDLADILLGDDDVLCLGAGDHDLLVLLVGCSSLCL